MKNGSWLITLFALMLAGCAGFGQQGMSAAEITAAAKEKTIFGQCYTYQGIYGNGTVITFAIDKDVIKNGDVHIAPQCTVSMTNSATQRLYKDIGDGTGRNLVPLGTPDPVRR